jgi:DNA invertase Pin-like site-specific DNA recombinase
LIAEVTEVKTGTSKKHRPELAAAIVAAKKAGVTLVIAKRGRLVRNVAFVSKPMETKVEFVAVDMPKANRLTIHIFVAMAEHEAEMISTRTKAALAAAKARLRKLGRKRAHPEIQEKAVAGLARAAAASAKQVD